MSNITFHPTVQIEYDVLVKSYQNIVQMYREFGATITVTATGTIIDSPISRVTFHKYPRSSMVTISCIGKHTHSTRIHQYLVKE